MDNFVKYYDYARSEVAEFLPSQYLKVLEIGCGEGNFRSNMKDSCEYWGVEPFGDASKTASHKLYKVLMGTYEEVFDQLPDNYFDLIICNDVIEHMHDHDLFLQSIKQKMTRDGVIIGSVPNVRYLKNLFSLLIEKDWMYKDAGILDRTHLRFFTYKSLKRIFLENNYLIEELHGINAIEFKFRSAKRFMQSIIASLLFRLLGGDTRYLQFGFRIRRQ